MHLPSPIAFPRLSNAARRRRRRPDRRVAPSANFTVSSEGATSAKRSSIFVAGDSLGVMENDSHGVPTSRSDATDSMPEIHAVGSTSSLHRTVVNCENHPVALLELRYFGPRLH